MWDRCSAPVMGGAGVLAVTLCTVHVSSQEARVKGQNSKIRNTTQTINPLVIHDNPQKELPQSAAGGSSITISPQLLKKLGQSIADEVEERVGKKMKDKMKTALEGQQMAKASSQSSFLQEEEEDSDAWVLDEESGGRNGHGLLGKNRELLWEEELGVRCSVCQSSSFFVHGVK